MGRLIDKSIYAIQHNVTGRIYVGCSLDYKKRIKQHISHLRNRNHSNAEMQKDYDNFGEDYSFYLIEDGIRFHGCFDREHEWMCMLGSNDINTGYNLMKQNRKMQLSDFKKLNVLTDARKATQKE